MDIVELLGRALDETGRIITGIRADQWKGPTPCEEWDVRTVVGHLVRGNQNTAAVAEGRPRDPNPIADVGADPVRAYHESAETVMRVWRQAGRLDEDYPTPLGMFPGHRLLSLRLADNVTHGWDLARATGQTPNYPDEVVAAATAFAETQFADNRPPGGAFAPSASAPDNAPPIDRLAAFLGRPV
ncbi:MAG TPA: TIGR03086 family metal-binding protein [Chloroflexota bacterium]|nr:TIGR03086 family metal-binding protein [Chloroflexota bacterium]